MPRMTVCVDWDHTLVDSDQEWLPGAVEAIRALANRRVRVIVHTCRANWPEGLAAVKAKCEGLPVTVWCEPGKPKADWYVDDLAVPFRGDWEAMLVQLLQIKEPVHRLARTPIPILEWPGAFTIEG